MRVRAASTLLLALAVLDLTTAGSVAGADAKLSGGTVTPATGTTATVFQFSVHFIGTSTDEAVTVSASVAGKTVPLSLSGSGTPRNGTWTGSSTLPAGSWTVTYRSTSTGLTNPSFTMPGQVVVTTPTPPPTPRPTPRSTPQATPRPTAVPTSTPPAPGSSVLPGVSPTPAGTTFSDSSGVPVSSASAASRAASTSPSASPSSAAGSDSRPFDIPPEGVVAIGLLGAVAVAAALGERRRRLAVEAFRAAELSPNGAIPPGDEDLSEGWDADPVDEETVATINYEEPGEPLDPASGSEPASWNDPRDD